MGVRLSERRISALKPESRRYDLWDADTPGLIVNVTPAGHRAYMLCRRMPGKWNPTRRLIAEGGQSSFERRPALLASGMPRSGEEWIPAQKHAARSWSHPLL